MIKKLIFVFASSLMILNAYAATPVVEDTSGKIVTSKAAVNKSMPGMIMVNGKVKNNDSSKHSFAITVTFLDKNGDIIGTASGAVNELGAGQTKTYQAIGQPLEGKYTKIEVQVDGVL